MVDVSNINVSAYSGIYCDSREVIPGSVFVAIKGPDKDGHKFIADAIERGARLIISQRPISSKAARNCIVDNPRKAYNLLLIKSRGINLNGFKFIGITGTNGKTTISFFIEQMLSDMGFASAVFGTINYRVKGRVISSGQTSPAMDIVLDVVSEALKEKSNFIVMEASSHALDQDRLYGIPFSLGIFTNLTQDHLDYHKTMGAYFDAKKKLFLEYALPGGVAVMDITAPFANELFAEIRQKRPDIKAFLLGSESFFIDGRSLVVNGRKIHLPRSIIGRYNLVNASLAFLALFAMGFDAKRLTKAVKSIIPAPGRMQVISCKGIDIIIDYAHTPDALKNVLLAVREECKYKRVICVFGCGGDRDKAKRPVMGSIAERLSDVVVVTSDNPRTEGPQKIIDNILCGFENKSGVIVEIDRRKAIFKALELSGKGDVVLIAGKGHEDYQEISGKRFPFSDKGVIEEWKNSG